MQESCMIIKHGMTCRLLPKLRLAPCIHDHTRLRTRLCCSCPRRLLYTYTAAFSRHSSKTDHKTVLQRETVLLLHGFLRIYPLAYSCAPNRFKPPCVFCNRKAAEHASHDQPGFRVVPAINALLAPVPDQQTRTAKRMESVLVVTITKAAGIWSKFNCNLSLPSQYPCLDKLCYCAVDNKEQRNKVVYLWSPFKGRRLVLAHLATVSEKPLSSRLFCSAVLLGRGRGICCRCAMRAAGWSCVSLPPVRTSPGNASKTHTCTCIGVQSMHVHRVWGLLSILVCYCISLSC